MKQIIPLLSLFFLGSAVWAQTVHPTCNGSRYLVEEFTNVDTTFNVLYGVNTTYQGNIDSLRMDIYQPAGDTATMRPLFIMAFGGSFVLGQREDMAPLCHFYAQRGFVAVTIDYRLFDGFFVPFPDSVVFADVAAKAIGDMKASVRYFIEDAATTNTYKIDPNMVFVGGGSSGAIMALSVAYLDSMDNIPTHIQTAMDNNGGMQGNTSNNTQYTYDIQGVLGFSGALASASWIDAGDAPLFCVHDELDNIVPYGQGYGAIVGNPISYLEGSQVLIDTAVALGIPNVLITIPGSTGHVTYVTGPWQDSVFSSTCVFLHSLICPLISPVDHVPMQNVAAHFYPNPTEVDMLVEIQDLPSAYHLVLYDNMGREVYRQNNINEVRFVLQSQHFVAGVYVVNIQFEDAAYAPVCRKVVFR